jgi:hypothetical protein
MIQFPRPVGTRLNKDYLMTGYFLPVGTIHVIGRHIYAFNWRDKLVKNDRQNFVPAIYCLRIFQRLTNSLKVIKID